MPLHGRITAQVLLLLLCAALVTACANLMVRRGLVLAGGLSIQGNGIPGLLLRLAKQWTFLLGLAGFALAALVWFRALSVADVSVCYPILVGLTFVMINVGAVLWLRESIGFLRIVGIAVILSGIALAART